MHALRRRKLSALITLKFKSDRGAFLKASGLTKGRLSQLLDESQPFGDLAARRLEGRLKLDPGYFDTMDERTLEFALAFERLPPSMKAKWEQLISVLSDPNPAQPS